LLPRHHRIFLEPRSMLDKGHFLGARRYNFSARSACCAAVLYFS